MSLAPTVLLYKPDLVFFEQILSHTWRLLCRGQNLEKLKKIPTSIGFPIFAHIYRGYLVAQWVICYQTKYKLNSVRTCPIFNVKKKEVHSIYKDLIIPYSIRKAVQSVLSPIIYCNRIYYPFPFDVYTDYDNQDYFHGSVIDGMNTKSIDFAASYCRVLHYLGLPLLKHSIELEKSSYLPGLTSNIFEMSNVKKDKTLGYFEKKVAYNFSTVVKPLKNAHSKMNDLLGVCVQNYQALEEFKRMKSLSPTKLVVCNQQGRGIEKLDVYTKCSFLTEKPKRIQMEISPDTICKVVINRKGDIADFNPENDEQLDLLETNLKHESGISDFMHQVIKGISINKEKEQNPIYIKGETKKKGNYYS